MQVRPFYLFPIIFSTCLHHSAASAYFGLSLKNQNLFFFTPAKRMKFI